MSLVIWQFIGVALIVVGTLIGGIATYISQKESDHTIEQLRTEITDSTDPSNIEEALKKRKQSKSDEIIKDWFQRLKIDPTKIQELGRSNHQEVTEVVQSSAISSELWPDFAVTLDKVLQESEYEKYKSQYLAFSQRFPESLAGSDYYLGEYLAYLNRQKRIGSDYDLMRRIVESFITRFTEDELMARIPQLTNLAVVSVENTNSEIAKIFEIKLHSPDLRDALMQSINSDENVAADVKAAFKDFGR